MTEESAAAARKIASYFCLTAMVIAGMWLNYPALVVVSFVILLLI